MILSWVKAQTAEQWHDYKGEMDALVKRLAHELSIEGVGEVKPEEIFAQFGEILYAAVSGQEVEIALLADLDSVQLKGFVTVAAADKGKPFGKSLVLLHAVKVNSLDGKEFDAALEGYLGGKAEEWDCGMVQFTMRDTHPALYGLKKRFGLKSLYTVYGWNPKAGG